MNPANKTLPTTFSTLQPFVAKWAIPTMSTRLQARLSSTPEERKAFFDALAPRLPEAFHYLNQYPLRAMPPDAECLFQLCLSMAEVTLAEEINGPKAEAEHAVYSRVMRVAMERDGL